MSERDIQTAIQRELSKGPSRLLRVNAGNSYNGTVISQTPQRLVLSPWYPIKLAATGVSDLIGFTQVGDLAQFVAIEVKDRGRLTEEQSNFIKLVRLFGGRAGLARSVEEAREIIFSNPTL